MSKVDQDGDQGVTESMCTCGEIKTMKEALHLAMQSNAAGVEEVDGIVTNYHAYPYCFSDADERYVNWTPRLPRAAYKYQYGSKDPVAFAHSGATMVQVLSDALNDLSAAVSKVTRH